MNLSMSGSDLTSIMGQIFTQFWPIIVIGLAFLANKHIINACLFCYNHLARGNGVIDIFTGEFGDKLRVRHWKRRGWIDNTGVFTDKMYREWKPHKRYRR